jgi:hypothetical protein
MDVWDVRLAAGRTARFRLPDGRSGSAVEVRVLHASLNIRLEAHSIAA